jgi:hypothetical protein
VSDKQNTNALKKLYPDYKKDQTMVVTRNLLYTDEEGNISLLNWSNVRAEVEDKYGRIVEDVVEQDKAELLGKAYFRVMKPGWTK